MLVMSADALASMIQDARLFQAELDRFRGCELADATPDAKAAGEARRRIVQSGFLWPTNRATDAEVGILYAACREAARIALARRSADFRAKWGIDLTCGDALVDEA